MEANGPTDSFTLRKQAGLGWHGTPLESRFVPPVLLLLLKKVSTPRCDFFIFADVNFWLLVFGKVFCPPIL